MGTRSVSSCLWCVSDKNCTYPSDRKEAEPAPYLPHVLSLKQTLSLVANTFLFSFNSLSTLTFLSHTHYVMLPATCSCRCSTTHCRSRSRLHCILDSSPPSWVLSTCVRCIILQNTTFRQHPLKCKIKT